MQILPNGEFPRLPDELLKNTVILTTKNTLILTTKNTPILTT